MVFELQGQIHRNRKISSTNDFLSYYMWNRPAAPVHAAWTASWCKLWHCLNVAFLMACAVLCHRSGRCNSSRCEVISSSLVVKCHCLFLLLAMYDIWLAKTKYSSATTREHKNRPTWREHFSRILDSGYIWDPTPQLLSWERWGGPRHLNAFQFVKFPIFAVDGRKRLETFTILLLGQFFYSFVREFLLRKT